VEKELVVEDPRRGKQQFTRSDESRDERAGVGVSRTAKRLERERETASGQYTAASIYPSSIFNCQSVCLEDGWGLRDTYTHPDG
jgi:hypothetical protein